MMIIVVIGAMAFLFAYKIFGFEKLMEPSKIEMRRKNAILENFL